MNEASGVRLLVVGGAVDPLYYHLMKCEVVKAEWCRIWRAARVLGWTELSPRELTRRLGATALHQPSVTP